MMKLLIFLLIMFSTPLQAKSFKLGDFDLGRIFAKQQKFCTSPDQCKTGLCLDGSCVYCSASKTCPSGQRCVMGTCLDDVVCLSDKDCKKGICDTLTGLCVECSSASDCQTGGQKGRTCLNNVCQDCPIDDPGCGSCDESQKPDGSGGCICADDAFNNDGKCSKLCDFTQCGNKALPLYDEKSSCCCTPCPNGTFAYEGECLNLCDFTICSSGKKESSGSVCCCL